MTCNSDWPEIQSQLQPGQDFSDIPVVVSHVFKQKLSLLLQSSKKMCLNTGQQCYSIHCIEFQKHGLPQAHIWMKYERDCVLPVDIDTVVSAEMPDDPAD